ncbi:hypothetical protein ACFVAJ_17715 [Agromyces sp. NPDC057679]|uniref:hypothetical protein n=1 Tax=Agromyces sp. NPDC057679 TaxID=3346207 RepID=UPI00366C3F22
MANVMPHPNTSSIPAAEQAASPGSTRPYKARLRDRFAAAAANWILNTFATIEYRSYVSVLYTLGREHLETVLRNSDEDQAALGKIDAPRN